MNSNERSNRLGWIKSELARLHKTLMDQHFPQLRGLPADDSQVFAEMVEAMDDEELAALGRMGESELTEWARQQIQEGILDGWFGEETVDVLIQHIGDLLAEHPEIPDADIELAVRYYAKRASTLELIDRFDDEADKWLALIKLAREDGSDAAEHSSER